MGHFKTFLTKAAANGLPVFLILFLLGNINWLSALALTFLLSGIAYLIDDLIILPAAGNLIATLADAFLGLGILWGARFFNINLLLSTILWVILILVLVEGLFYHPYLKRLVSLDSMGPKTGDRK